MDDHAAPPPDASPDAPRPRRKGLHVPLPAVVIGLGLASAPAAAQLIARNDFYEVPEFTLVTLPVLGNDTINTSAFWYISSFSPAANGLANTAADLRSMIYRGDPGFRGIDGFGYCVTTVSPPATNCATVVLAVGIPETTPVPALGGAALAGLSGALGWLGMRGRRRR